MKINEWTVETMRGWIRGADPNLSEADEAFEAALVLLAALRLGHRDRGRLAEFTGVHPYRVNLFAERLEAAQVWAEDGMTACTWWDKDSNDLDFWLDVSVATGLLERSLGADATPVYREATYLVRIEGPDGLVMNYEATKNQIERVCELLPGHPTICSTDLGLPRHLS
jgi:hypothetical protein